VYRSIKREMVVVTPEKASEILKHNIYVTQRKLRPAHVNDLASKMEKGLFRFGEIAIAHTWNGSKFQMNGQHVCNAIIKSGLGQECVIEEFQVSDATELSVLFRQFEILPRTLSDMVSVESHALGLDWPTWISNIVVSSGAIVFYNQRNFKASQSKATSNRYKSITKDDRVDLLKIFIKEGNFLKKLLVDDTTNSDLKHMKRAAVCAMIFKTFAIDEKASEAFWVGVRDGEYLTQKDPQWLLREFLRSNNMMSYRGQYTYRPTTNHEVAYRSALTWNAFREGRKISKTSYFPEKDIPKLK